jgi:16S rRNA (uracil1498-N3)-methyltransferase
VNRPPRFKAHSISISKDSAQVAGDELHHLRDVRRLSPGDPVELIDDQGMVHLGRISEFKPDVALITLEGLAEVGAKTARVILAAAIIKGPRMDFLVEKAVELGADELWPLETAHGVVQHVSTERRERWHRLAAAAAKQSLNATLMTIAAPSTVAAMTAIVPSDALAILCAEGGKPLSRILREHRAPAILIACGPEGDFDQGERERMISSGFVIAGLGLNRLRSETAALAALSIVGAELYDQNRGSSRGI